MLTTSFKTRDLPQGVQFDSWRDWYGGVFETTTDVIVSAGFEAANSNWTIGGLTVSEVASPPVSVARSRPFVRRNPVDHWMMTLSNNSASEVTTRDRQFRVPAGVPFLLSLGEEMSIRREVGESRMQFLLSRDAFTGSEPLLDAAVGMPLDGPRGALLADFLRMVKASLPTLSDEEASRVKGAAGHDRGLPGALGQRPGKGETLHGGHLDATSAHGSGSPSVLAIARHDETVSGGCHLALPALSPAQGPRRCRTVHPAPSLERKFRHPLRHVARLFHRTCCRDVVLCRCFGVQPVFSPRVRDHAEGGASGGAGRAPDVADASG